MLRWLVCHYWCTGFRATGDQGVDEGCWIRLPAYCLSDDLDGDNPASLEQLQGVKQALDEQLVDIRKQLQEGQSQTKSDMDRQLVHIRMQLEQANKVGSAETPET